MDTIDSNEKLKEIAREDRYRPTLRMFFLLEVGKWGSLLLLAYIALTILINFSRPIWEPIFYPEDVAPSEIQSDEVTP